MLKVSESVETTAVAESSAGAGVRTILPALAIGLFVVLVLRCAWVSEDAYISFRTVDNFTHGYGLTWNVLDRVQTYTHPLWLLLVSAVYVCTDEIFYTVMLLATVVSALACVVLALKVARTTMSATIAVVALCFSKAFIDFSTSGLENPLSHLILAVFFMCYFGGPASQRRLLLLSLLASAGTLTRMDHVLLFAPILLYSAWALPKKKSLLILLLGFTPFVAWECCSLLYYGFLLPNTYYAKLSVGLTWQEFARQGFHYLLSSLHLDPLTLMLIICGCALPIISKRKHDLPVAIGVFVYMCYVIRIGGDHMNGRFLTAPLFCAVVLIARQRIDSLHVGLLALAPIVIMGLGSPISTLSSDAGYALKLSGKQLIDDHGVGDERGHFYRSSSLLRAKRHVDGPLFSWEAQGRIARSKGPHVEIRRNVGFLGFFAGPDVHIVDTLALTEPLLARLPAKRDPYWRIGHFVRRVPEGYFATLNSEWNVISDPQLAEFYDRLKLITRGPLFSRKRLREIWRMNTGQNDHLVAFDDYRLPSLKRVELGEVNTPKPAGTPTGSAGNIRLTNSGVEVRFDAPSHAKRLQISVDRNDTYILVYMLENRTLARQTLVARLVPSKGLAVFEVEVPRAAYRGSYDKIRVLPAAGKKPYVLGHLRLME